MEKLFSLEILSPDRQFFCGDVEAFTVRTPTGEMGILYHTLPCVTLLAGGIIRIKQSGKWMEAVADEGFLRVGRDKVTVLTQSCLWPYEIDAEALGEEIEDSRTRMDKSQSMREYKIAKAQLAAALAKLRLTGRGE